MPTQEYNHKTYKAFLEVMHHVKTSDNEPRLDICLDMAHTQFMVNRNEPDMYSYAAAEITRKRKILREQFNPLEHEQTK